LALCALGAQGAFTPFPPITDRDAWENKADKKGLEMYLKYAEQNIDFAWPALPAADALTFLRDGNRSRYESVSFHKRALLATMLIAELAENKGRFIDPIVNLFRIIRANWGDNIHRISIKVTNPEAKATYHMEITKGHFENRVAE
jgi:hypothetical protein